MAWSDFNWVPIEQTFNDTNLTATVNFPIAGNAEIVGEPVDDAYLLIQAKNVSSNSHRIFINNEPLRGIDIPSHSGWQTWMDRIRPGLLRRGTNEIRIERTGSDQFRVHAVAVNWRESESLQAGVRSDFNWVHINETFDGNNHTTTRVFPIEGLEEHGGEPIDDAYLLIQAHDVSSNAHRIFINDDPLRGIDIPAQSGWQTWMDRIRPDLLLKGDNRIRIERAGNDQFSVAGVAIKWRETTSTLQVPRNVVFSDFNWVPVEQTFNDQNRMVTVEFPIEGSALAENPIDDAYLLIQARNVSSASHRIFVNDTQLLQTVPPHSGWQTWMSLIPPGTLLKGTNRIRIERTGNDQFHVHGMVVNWREKAAAISP